MLAVRQALFQNYITEVDDTFVLLVLMQGPLRLIFLNQKEYWLNVCQTVQSDRGLQTAPLELSFICRDSLDIFSLQAALLRCCFSGARVISFPFTHLYQLQKLQSDTTKKHFLPIDCGDVSTLSQFPALRNPKQQLQQSKGRLGSDKSGLMFFQRKTLVFVNDVSTPMGLTWNRSAMWPVFQLNSSAGCGIQICDLLPAACVYLQQKRILQHWE